MTTVQIKLPDELAQEAERAGLLAPEALEKILRAQLRSQRVDQLLSAMERMNTDGTPAMTPEEVAEEITAMRAERRRT